MAIPTFDQAQALWACGMTAVQRGRELSARDCNDEAAMELGGTLVSGRMAGVVPAVVRKGDDFYAVDYHAGKVWAVFIGSEVGGSFEPRQFP
jgi:hypothetical protein